MEKDTTQQISWKVISDFPEYEVSTVGVIRRVIGKQIRKPSPNHKGYLRIRLSNKGFTKQFAVHRIVMKAFVGEIPQDYQVNHINGIKDDNRLENLEYVTPKENIKHAMKMLPGYPFGAKNNNAKLNEWQVRVIRRLFPRELKTREIASFFNVSEKTILEIKKGNRYTRIH